MRYQAAVVQFEPVMHEKEQNLRKLCALVEEAGRAEAKLVVLPEMATTGYCFAGRREIAQQVEPVPGPTTERFGQLCQQFQMWLVVGMAEAAPDGAFYNSAVLIGPSGRVAGRYRKTHLFTDDCRWAVAGNELPVFDTPLGRLAMLICMDADYPEPARLAALAEADLIAFPTNWLGQAPSAAWRTRAAENGQYWLCANRYGQERGVQFSGGSCVIAPTGRVLAQKATGDAVVLAMIDVSQAREKRRPGVGHLLQGRQPATYQDIRLPRYLWGEDPGLSLPTPRTATLALVQDDVDPANPGATRERLTERVEEAIRVASTHAQPLDLVVLPPLVAPEEIPGPRQAAIWAEPLNGAHLGWLLRLAQLKRLHLASSFLEWDGGGMAFTSVLAGPAGLLAAYRHVHLPPAGYAWARQGCEYAVADTPFGRVGLLGGTDLWFPEAMRCLALQGAHLVVASAAMVELPAFLGANRAIENGAYLAVANRAAGRVSYGGGSGLWGEEGEASEPLGREPGLIVAQARLAEPWVRKKALLGMRATHLYAPLTAERETPSVLPVFQHGRGGNP